ncbi:uncharacterized protein LOC129600801 [Paramacrobiotus metropolitanus]|uniref:uncharacterized protein LOC129600801 n=1 Tax=Paramacrobiotus metropolitanus TaxID=2943436 RepID=UPI0024462D4E|nr:uncharacterized protein LOC129600801 [Paramacrobiotus metropolitanus]
MVLLHPPSEFYLFYHFYVFLFFLSPHLISVVFPLVCNRCQLKEHRDRCLAGLANDTAETCKPNTITCVTVTGIRQDFTFSDFRNTPAMSRHCSFDIDAVDDADKFRRLPKGQEFICFNVTREDPFGPNGQWNDRRCLCAKDKCNNKMWDEVFMQPTLPENFTDKDKLVVPTGLGSNSLANISAWSNYTVIASPSGNGNNADGSGGAAIGTTTETSGNNTTAGGNSTSGTDSHSNPAASGSNTGLIIGIAVGVVILAAAVGGGLWYWFKVRRRKGSSTSSGASDNTAGTEASEDDDE